MVEVKPASPLMIRDPNHINIDHVRHLVSICLRLENLTSPSTIILSPSTTITTTPLSPRLLASPQSGSIDERNGGMIKRSSPPPAFLGPAVREDMTDEELSLIIESLTTRIENSVSTLVNTDEKIIPTEGRKEADKDYSS